MSDSLWQYFFAIVSPRARTIPYVVLNAGAAAALETVDNPASLFFPLTSDDQMNDQDVQRHDMQQWLQQCREKYTFWFNRIDGSCLVGSLLLGERVVNTESNLKQHADDYIFVLGVLAPVCEKWGWWRTGGYRLAVCRITSKHQHTKLESRNTPSPRYSLERRNLAAGVLGNLSHFCVKRLCLLVATRDTHSSKSIGEAKCCDTRHRGRSLIVRQSVDPIVTPKTRRHPLLAGVSRTSGCTARSLASRSTLYSSISFLASAWACLIFSLRSAPREVCVHK